MSDDDVRNLVNRRRVLTSFGTMGVGALTLLQTTAVAQQNPPAAETPAPSPTVPDDAGIAVADGYQAFAIGESAVVEALVDHMWPADQLTLSGTAIGIATFIDRQLAGAFGQGDRLYLNGPFRRGKPEHGYQVAMTPEDYFKQGLKGLDSKAKSQFGNPVDRLSADQLQALLIDISTNSTVVEAIDLKQWFDGLFYPLFLRGAFADPIYGGNKKKQAWQMIGYPGLPATYTSDMTAYRGKRHPGSDAPMSMQDFY